MEKYFIDDVPKRKYKAIFKRENGLAYPLAYFKKPAWVEQVEFDAILADILIYVKDKE